MIIKPRGVENFFCSSFARQRRGRNHIIRMLSSRRVTICSFSLNYSRADYARETLSYRVYITRCSSFLSLVEYSLYKLPCQIYQKKDTQLFDMKDACTRLFAAVGIIIGRNAGDNLLPFCNSNAHLREQKDRNCQIRFSGRYWRAFLKTAEVEKFKVLSRENLKMITALDLLGTRPEEKNRKKICENLF